MPTYTVRYNRGGDTITRTITCDTLREDQSYTYFIQTGEWVVAAIPTSLVLDIFEVSQQSAG